MISGDSRLLRRLERIFKLFFVRCLRALLGSSVSSLPPHAVFKTILVIRQHNQLGDMLCVVPLLKGLRNRFPDAFIALVASPVNYEVMLNNPFVDEVIEYDKSEFLARGRFRFGRILQFIKSLRAYNFELAIVPSTVSTSVTSDMLAYLLGARARIGAGSINGRPNPSGFFFNVPVRLDWTQNPHRHQTLRNVDIAAPLALRQQDCSLHISLKNNEVTEAKLLYSKAKMPKSLSILLHPGAGKKPNRWPADRFALVANILGAEYDAMVLITSGPFDDGPVSEVEARLSAYHKIIANKPIRHVAAILSLGDLLITNDTGIMHVGAAVGIPVLSLFGPTDPNQWAPMGALHRYVKGEKGDITSIRVEVVLRHAREMLRASIGMRGKIEIPYDLRES